MHVQITELKIGKMPKTWQSQINCRWAKCLTCLLQRNKSETLIFSPIQSSVTEKHCYYCMKSFYKYKKSKKILQLHLRVIANKIISFQREKYSASVRVKLWEQYLKFLKPKCWKSRNIDCSHNSRKTNTKKRKATEQITIDYFL